MPRNASLISALAIVVAATVPASAQDAAGPRSSDCPPVTAATQSAPPAAKPAAKPAATKSRGFADARGWSPVGTPGMFTGIDTGVTRGPVGRSNSTTGLFGAGSESETISAPPPADPAAAAAEAPRKADQAPCPKSDTRASRQ